MSNLRLKYLQIQTTLVCEYLILQIGLYLEQFKGTDCKTNAKQDYSLIGNIFFCLVEPFERGNKCLHIPMLSHVLESNMFTLKFSTHILFL